MRKWKKPLALILAAVLCLGILAACGVVREDPPADDVEGCYFLICREGVWEVSVTTKDGSGGVVNADGSHFEVGEKVYLEQFTNIMDLQGAEIAALDQDGEVIHRISVPVHLTAEEIDHLAKESGWLILPVDFAISGVGGADGPTDVTVTPSAFPITADYTCAELEYAHVYETPETEYVTYMDILIHENITDVSFGLLNWDGAQLFMEKTLYAAPSMKAGETFLAAVVFYGDMTTYGISFTDAAGESRHFSFVISGKDGSLECIEYKS